MNYETSPPSETSRPAQRPSRIAQEIAHAFGIDINKDIVRRVLGKHYRPEAGTDGPSWLSFIGHMKDSLWSVDLFRCESILLRSHWVMVVMDVFTRRIIGFGVDRSAGLIKEEYETQAGRTEAPTARSPVAGTVDAVKPLHAPWPSSDEPRVSR